MASTVKVDKIEGSTGSTVEVTAGQTFKATAPIIATSILDALRSRSAAIEEGDEIQPLQVAAPVEKESSDA